MADSVSTEAWLDQRRWAALEEALKAQGSNVKRHLQDYLITLYNETVPLEQWTQIETAITKEELLDLYTALCLGKNQFQFI